MNMIHLKHTIITRKTFREEQASIQKKEDALLTHPLSKILLFLIIQQEEQIPQVQHRMIRHLQ